MIVLAENTQLVRQFRNLASCLDSGIVQFRPLQSYDDYIGFLDKYLCAYISNSSWDFNVFCSIVLGLRADGMVQLEIWQGEEQFDQLYLRERLFTSVALQDLPYSVKRASFCLESAGGWSRIRECLQRELAFVSRTRSRIRGSIISYPVCRLCEVLHTGGDITFGNELNPESGWALVLVGGSGSGKSAVLRRATNFQSKIFDVDDIKSAYNTAVRIKQNHPDWAPKHFASGDERIRDLSNQIDSEEMHKIMTEYRFDQLR